MHGPRPAPDPADSRRLLEHALLLLARQQGGDAVTAAAAQAELAHWRARDPRHEAAAQAAASAWGRTDAASLRGHIAHPQRASSAARRAVLGACGLIVLTGSVGMFGYRQWLRPSLQLALATGHGEWRGHDLPDGSRVDLAAASHLRLTYRRSRREAWLTAGEAMFTVMPGQPPFVVHTPWGSVRVLGTRFSVAAQDEGIEVRVASGQVAVWTHTQPLSLGERDDVPAMIQDRVTRAHAPHARLGAGQAWSAHLGRAAAPRNIATSAVGRWREGWLVFDATPLADAVARWNTYHRPALSLAADPALRQLRVSGSFPLSDPQAFVISLPRILPVCLEDGQRITASCAR